MEPKNISESSKGIFDGVFKIIDGTLAEHPEYSKYFFNRFHDKYPQAYKTVNNGKLVLLNGDTDIENFVHAFHSFYQDELTNNNKVPLEDVYNIFIGEFPPTNKVYCASVPKLTYLFRGLLGRIIQHGRTKYFYGRYFTNVINGIEPLSNGSIREQDYLIEHKKDNILYTDKQAIDKFIKDISPKNHSN